jgi:hypothetical protein
MGVFLQDEAPQAQWSNHQQYRHKRLPICYELRESRSTRYPDPNPKRMQGFPGYNFTCREHAIRIPGNGCVSIRIDLSDARPLVTQIPEIPATPMESMPVMSNAYAPMLLPAWTWHLHRPDSAFQDFAN